MLVHGEVTIRHFIISTRIGVHMESVDTYLQLDVRLLGRSWLPLHIMAIILDDDHIHDLTVNWP